MGGVRVGKRVIGAQAPVTIGWENIPKVEGGPLKRFVFTWFQRTMLFALIAFWFYAPNSIATASTAIAVGTGFKVLLLGLEWLTPAGSPYHAVPWFWSTQYDLRLQTVGLSAGHDLATVRGDIASRAFSVVYHRQGRVIALDCINSAKDCVQGRKLVKAGSRVPAGPRAGAFA